LNAELALQQYSLLAANAVLGLSLVVMATLDQPDYLEASLILLCLIVRF
jgi:hypothetical protein